MTALLVLMMAIFAGALILMIATSRDASSSRTPRLQPVVRDGASFPVYMDGGSLGLQRRRCRRLRRYDGGGGGGGD